MSKTIWKLCLLFFLLPLVSSGTHIIGGEMTYECLGYDEETGLYSYEVSSIVYRDCGPNNVNNTDFDSQAGISFFQNYQLIADMLIPFTYAEEINTDIESPCYSDISSACVEKTTYKALIDIDFTNGPVEVAYQRCCRNNSVVNLVNPDETGTTLTVQIPVPLSGECNSSPTFNALPPVFICVGDLVNLDFSASDPDGDDLVYRLCSPFSGGDPVWPAPVPADPPPYYPVNWEDGYNEQMPFNSSPEISFNSENGLLNATVTQAGIYATGVCVDEYRDGVLLSTIKRDYQVFVFNCPLFIDANFDEQSIDQFCDGLTITFDNLSQGSNQFFWDFGVEDVDSDTSNLTYPTFTFPESGFYDVMLIAGGTDDCADTAYGTYYVQPPVEVEMVIFEPTCDEELLYSFDVVSNAENGEFTWTFGNFAISTDPNPTDIPFSIPGEFEVVLNYDYNGCVDNIFKTLEISPKPQAIINPQPITCIGMIVQPENASTDASAYYWTLSNDEILSVSFQENPIFDVPEEGDYSLRLVVTSDSICFDTATAYYTAYPLLEAFFEMPEPIACFDDQNFSFEAGGSFQENAEFLWTFGPLSNTGTITTSMATNVVFDGLGKHIISLTVFENGCEHTYTDSITLQPNPTSDFITDIGSGCVPLTVNFYNQSEGSTLLNYKWDFGDGSYSSVREPSHSYVNPGIYPVKLYVFTTSGCIDTVISQLPDPVHAYKNPEAGFMVNDREVDILDPHIFVTDTSIGALHISYLVNGTEMIDARDFEFSFDEGGYQNIQQVAINENNCVDTHSETILVKGLLVFMANAFTPNGDGINDAVKPSTVGVESYRYQIFDRWGNMLFETTNPEEEWEGNNSPEGVYNYIIRANDVTKEPHLFTGSILLIR